MIMFVKRANPPKNTSPAFTNQLGEESYDVTHYEFTGNVFIMYDVVQRWFSMGSWAMANNDRRRVIAIALLPGDTVTIV